MSCPARRGTRRAGAAASARASCAGFIIAPPLLRRAQPTIFGDCPGGSPSNFRRSRPAPPQPSPRSGGLLPAAAPGRCWAARCRSYQHQLEHLPFYSPTMSLKFTSFTCTHYDEGDTLGKLLAYAAITPLLLMFYRASRFYSRRRVRPAGPCCAWLIAARSLGASLSPACPQPACLPTASVDDASSAPTRAARRAGRCTRASSSRAASPTRRWRGC
jgi:hypothetical protein